MKHILISTGKVKCMLRKDCKGFLGHVIKEEDNLVWLADVYELNQFPDIFLEDLPRLLPGWEVKFNIDLLLGTNPISLAPNQ